MDCTPTEWPESPRIAASLHSRHIQIYGLHSDRMARITSESRPASTRAAVAGGTCSEGPNPELSDGHFIYEAKCCMGRPMKHQCRMSFCFTNSLKSNHPGSRRTVDHSLSCQMAFSYAALNAAWGAPRGNGFCFAPLGAGRQHQPLPPPAGADNMSPAFAFGTTFRDSNSRPPDASDGDELKPLADAPNQCPTFASGGRAGALRPRVMLAALKRRPCLSTLPTWHLLVFSTISIAPYTSVQSH